VLFCIRSSDRNESSRTTVPLPHESPLLFPLLFIGGGPETVEIVDCEVDYHGMGSVWNSCVSPLSGPFSLSVLILHPALMTELEEFTVSQNLEYFYSVFQ